MIKYEKEALLHHLDAIWKQTVIGCSIPTKSMNQYTVDDIVILKNGYKSIQEEIESIVSVFELKED